MLQSGQNCKQTTDPVQPIMLWLLFPGAEFEWLCMRYMSAYHQIVQLGKEGIQVDILT